MLEKVQTTKSQIDTGMKGKQIACQVLNFSMCPQVQGKFKVQVHQLEELSTKEKQFGRG